MVLSSAIKNALHIGKPKQSHEMTYYKPSTVNAVFDGFLCMMA